MVQWYQILLIEIATCVESFWERDMETWWTFGHHLWRSQDNLILLYQVVPSASKIEAEILSEFELNLDHPGGG